MRLWVPMLLTNRGESSTQAWHLCGKSEYMIYITICMGRQSLAPCTVAAPQNRKDGGRHAPLLCTAPSHRYMSQLLSDAPHRGSSHEGAQDGFHSTEDFVFYQVWCAAQCP